MLLEYLSAVFIILLYACRPGDCALVLSAERHRGTCTICCCCCLGRAVRLAFTVVSANLLLLSQLLLLLLVIHLLLGIRPGATPRAPILSLGASHRQCQLLEAVLQSISIYVFRLGVGAEV